MLAALGAEALVCQFSASTANIKENALTPSSGALTFQLSNSNP